MEGLCDAENVPDSSNAVTVTQKLVSPRADFMKNNMAPSSSSETNTDNLSENSLPFMKS
jgi:hypothetical protein